MNDFSFQNTTKAYFGKNAETHIVEEIKKVGNSVLFVYGGGSIKKNGLYDKLHSLLEEGNIEVTDFAGIEPNPHHTTINKAATICKEKNISAVLAVGGGSVIDAAKGIGALAVHKEEDIWTLVNAHKPITKALPIYAVVTMAATGSEMDASAVISNEDLQLKSGINGPGVRPTACFLNPENTFTVSAFQTACGSFDIMSHTMDTKYFSKDDKMDMLYRMMDEHLKTVVKWAPIALKEPENYDARANLMWAATWALNSFMTCGVHQMPACHNMGHPLTAKYGITHGLTLAILTPRWMEYILNEETAPSIRRLGDTCFNIDSSLNDIDGAKATIEAFKDFITKDLGLDLSLRNAGVEDDSKFHEMALEACGPKGVIPSIVDLTPEDVENIYKMCM